MFHIHALHVNYFLFGLFGVVVLFFHILKWDFISQALSDKGRPSAFRLCAYVFVLTVAINEMYTTFRTQQFNTTHLLYLLVGIGVLLGLVNVEKVMSIWKGRDDSKDEPKQNNP